MLGSWNLQRIKCISFFVALYSSAKDALNRNYLQVLKISSSGLLCPRAAWTWSSWWAGPKMAPAQERGSLPLLAQLLPATIKVIVRFKLQKYMYHRRIYPRSRSVNCIGSHSSQLAEAGGPRQRLQGHPLPLCNQNGNSISVSSILSCDQLKTAVGSTEMWSQSQGPIMCQMKPEEWQN